MRKTLDSLSPKKEIPLHFPPRELCTDNAAMIAWVGIGRLDRGRIDKLDVMQRSKWGIEECESEFEDALVADPSQRQGE